MTDHATAGARELYDRKNYIGAYVISGTTQGFWMEGVLLISAGEATLKDV